jgi:hypothetical protein
MPPFSRDDNQRVDDLITLKEFAVQKGYSVPDKLIQDIAEVEYKFLRAANRPQPDANDLGNIDRLAIELTQITYPVTVSNIRALGSISGVTWFVYGLLFFGLLAAFGAGWAAWVAKRGTEWGGLAEGALPLALGAVGAVVYVMLPNGRLNVVAGLDAENRAFDVVRVVIGGLLGFVLYVLRPVATTGGAASFDSWTLIIPLIGGYSVSLVVGILAKAVAAVQLALNIDEKSVRASLQK